MKRAFVGLLLVGLLLIPAAGSSSTVPARISSSCSELSPFLEQPAYELNVNVLRRVGVSCDHALRIARAAYSTPHLHIEWGPQFGAGGYGGPFRVGRYHCFLMNRGSDFKNARCRYGHEYVRFYDHRDISGY